MTVHTALEFHHRTVHNTADTFVLTEPVLLINDSEGGAKPSRRMGKGFVPSLEVDV